MTLADSIRFPARTAHRPHRFTGFEVRRLLARNTDDPRTRAVRRCATRPTEWLATRSTLVACPARYVEELPRLVFWAMCGESLTCIAPRVDGWLVDNRLVDPELALALAFANHQIARCLNATPERYNL